MRRVEIKFNFFKCGAIIMWVISCVQLVAPRNAVDADCARSTASTHSAGSRGLFSTVSSTMIPPSEVCRRVLKNAQVHMVRVRGNAAAVFICILYLLLQSQSRSRQINRGTALQRQLQIVQEELLLGAPSRVCLLYLILLHFFEYSINLIGS